MNPKDIYPDILKDIKLMQLASVRDNKPWMCNVWYVMDEDHNVYWISRETRRHSLEIENNPHVAATMHPWFDKGLMNDPGQAMIISGQAKKLSGKECRMPYELYAKRFPKLLEFQSFEKFLNDEGHHYFYKITPDEIIWWDEINFPKNPKQEVL